MRFLISSMLILVLSSSHYAIDYGFKFGFGSSYSLLKSEKKLSNPAGQAPIFSIGLTISGLSQWWPRNTELGLETIYLPLYSKETGAFKTNLVMVPITLETRVFAVKQFSVDLGLRLGSGYGRWQNQFNQQSIANPLAMAGFYQTVRYRRFSPNVFWLSLNQTAVKEFLTTGLSKNTLMSFHIQMGFSIYIVDIEKGKNND